jgi:hypothetical protein
MDLDDVKLLNNVKAIQVPSPMFCLLLRSVILYLLISYAIYLTTLQQLSSFYINGRFISE